MTISLTVNGETMRADAGVSLAGFLKSRELDPKKVAVERNLEIVPKSTFDTVPLEEGDRLEIVHFIGGG